MSTKENQINEEVDTTSPKIRWISPSFDSIVKNFVQIQCIITDENNINSIELWADTLQINNINFSNLDSLYKVNWVIKDFKNGSQPLIFVKAIDSAGNEIASQKVRIIINQNYDFSEPLLLYTIDSLFVDTLFSGYSLDWELSQNPYFKKYILNKSSNFIMSAASEIFSTDDKFVNEYNDLTVDTINYYQIIEEDIFGNATTSNVESTSQWGMPEKWEIESVSYTEDLLNITWYNNPFNLYKEHKLLYSNQRNGEYQILEIFNDSLINKFENDSYIPYEENWFYVITEDSLGQQSIGEPYIHPFPQVPEINSVVFDGNSFTIEWENEPDIDFISYTLLYTDSEDAFNLIELDKIFNQNQTIKNNINVILGQYYLFQIVTKDAWGLITPSPIIISSAFDKFELSYDNGSSDKLFSVLSNNQNEYIAVGESSQNGRWYLHLESNGEIKQSFNTGIQSSVYNSVALIAEGGSIATGYQIINEEKDLIIDRFGTDGDLIWSKNYNIEYSNGGNTIIELSNKSIVVVGFSHVNTLNQDILVMSIDQSDGNEKWRTIVGGSERDEGYDIIESELGGMFVLGQTYSSDDDNGDILILEINSIGDVIDTLLIDIPGKQVGYSFQISEFGNFVIAGETSGSNGVSNALILEVDPNGNVQWISDYGGSYNDVSYSLINSVDGWVIAGQTFSYDNEGGDAWLLKVNEYGEFDWMKNFGDVNLDEAYSINLAKDGGFIVSGTTYSKDNEYDGWLLKTDSRGNSVDLIPYP